VLAAGTAASCGKKGPPLAPLPRVPAAPANPQAARVGDDVYLWFGVPAANVSGQAPADITAVDLYAVTAVSPPTGDDLTRAAVRVASYPVYLPAPPLPDPEAGAPAPPPLPSREGFAQGVVAVVRETLTAETRQPTALAAAPAVEPDDEAATEPLPGPLVSPGESTLKRHYFLVSLDRRGRPGSFSPVVSVPVADGADPPADVELSYTDSAITLAWTPAANARVAPAAPAEAEGLLPSKPLVAPPPPTSYHVFEVPRTAVDPGPYGLTLPVPLTPQPVAASSFEIPGAVAFGTERCFVVRPVDRVAGATVVGQATPPACVTPVDTFAPAAPRQLAAIAGTGVINLIWEANDEADLAGYVVLRGPAPDGPLQPLMREPIRETTYRDQTATPGVRYVYAVVAVDTATPPNVSPLSNRVEEESRTP
jgi:hypothetical protein